MTVSVLSAENVLENARSRVARCGRTAASAGQHGFVTSDTDSVLVSTTKSWSRKTTSVLRVGFRRSLAVVSMWIIVTTAALADIRVVSAFEDFYTQAATLPLVTRATLPSFFVRSRLTWSARGFDQ